MQSRSLFGRHFHDCTQCLVPCLYGQCYERCKFANLLRDFQSKHRQFEVLENGSTMESWETLPLTLFPVKRFSLF